MRIFTFLFREVQRHHHRVPNSKSSTASAFTHIIPICETDRRSDKRRFRRCHRRAFTTTLIIARAISLLCALPNSKKEAKKWTDHRRYHRRRHRRRRSHRLVVVVDIIVIAIFTQFSLTIFNFRLASWSRSARRAKREEKTKYPLILLYSSSISTIFWIDIR